MKAFEVSDGFDKQYCLDERDVELVSNEWQRRAAVINWPVRISVTPVEIIGIPEGELEYLRALRAAATEARRDR